MEGEHRPLTGGRGTPSVRPSSPQPCSQPKPGRAGSHTQAHTCACVCVHDGSVFPGSLTRSGTVWPSSGGKDPGALGEAVGVLAFSPPARDQGSSVPSSGSRSPPPVLRMFAGGHANAEDRWRRPSRMTTWRLPMKMH